MPGLELHVRPEGDCLVLQVADRRRRGGGTPEAAGGASAALLRPRVDELKRLVGQVALRGSVTATDKASWVALGQALHDMLVPPQLRPILRDGLGGPLWLRLRSWAVEIPWEWLDDGQGPWFERYSIGREVPVAPAARSLPADEPACPAQAVVLGDPAGDLPHARLEVDAVHRALRTVGLRPRTRSGELLVDDLRVTLRAADIVHIASHVDPPIVVPDASVDSSWQGPGVRCIDGHLRASDLTAMGGTAPFPSLVVLNGCSSATLAPALLASGAGHVVATQTDVGDETARQVAVALYQGLARGLSLGASLRSARSAVSSPLLAAPWLLYGDPVVDLAAGFPATERPDSAKPRRSTLGVWLAVSLERPGRETSGDSQRPGVGPARDLRDRFEGLRLEVETVGRETVVARVPLRTFGDVYGDVALAVARLVQVEAVRAGLVLGIGLCAGGAKAHDRAVWLSGQARPDAPLLDDRVRALVRTVDVSFTRHPAALAGDARIWRATWAGEGRLTEQPAELLGIDAPMAGVSAVLEETVDSGRPHLALLTGPAGSGKTSLLGELGRELLSRGIRVVRGEADVLGRFRVDGHGSTDSDATTSVVAAMVRGSLAGAPVPAAGAGPWQWAQALKDRSGAMVWMIDRAERLGAAFVTDIEGLLDQVEESMLCIVVAMRADRAEDKARAERLAVRATRIPVPALRAADARRLLCRRLGVDSLPPELEPLVSQAAGNPLVLVRGLEHMRSHGVLRRPGRSLLIDPARLETVPPAPLEEALVADRLSNVEPAVRTVVEFVAVFGGDAPTGAIETAPQVAPAALRRAVSLGWLRMRSAAGFQRRETRASLRDPLVARVLPRLVPATRARPMHDAALAWLEAEQAPPGERAFHALNSSDPLQAIPPLWEEILARREGGDFEGVLATLDPLERLLAASPESDLPPGTPAPATIRAIREAAERLQDIDDDSTDLEGLGTKDQVTLAFDAVEGQSVGRYELEEVLAVGSTGTVYRAVLDGPEGFRREVALKVLHRQLADSATFLKAFQREARLAARLRHPNVVAVTDLGQAGDDWYLAMDYVDGCSLRRLLAEGGPLPGDVALHIASGIAAGLCHGHTSVVPPVVHRDVCPENVMVDREGIVRVYDFGLARAADTIGPPTETGALRGRASYVAPERLEEGELGPACDLWSLGGVLYELLTGDRLFAGRTILQVLDAICMGDLTSATERVTAVDAELGGWFRQMLVRDPGGRLTDAGALAEALDRMAVRMQPFEETARRRLGALVVSVLDSEG